MTDLSDLFGLQGEEPRWSKCPKCGTESARPEGEDCWTCTQRADARRELGRRREVTGWRLPNRFVDARFGTKALVSRVRGGGGSQSSFERARRAVTAQHLVIRGNTAGIGKTTLVAAMMHEWLDTSDGLALFVPARRLSGGGFALDAELLGAALVVLDDLGAERGLASSLVPDLISERYDANLAMWVTTSMVARGGNGVVGIREMYGEGILRRIFEKAVVIDFDAGAK